MNVLEWAKKYNEGYYEEKVKEEDVTRALERINKANIDDFDAARKIVKKAWMQAHRLIAQELRAWDGCGPVDKLIETILAAELRPLKNQYRGTVAKQAPEPSSERVQAPVADNQSDEDYCPYISRTETRFTDVIDRIVEDQIKAGSWKADRPETRRILRSFAFITGNKPLHAYRPSDIADFAHALDAVPSDFAWTRWMGKEGETFSFSFEEALAAHLALPQKQRHKDAAPGRDLLPAGSLDLM